MRCMRHSSFGLIALAFAVLAAPGTVKSASAGWINISGYLYSPALQISASEYNFGTARTVDGYGYGYLDKYVRVWLMCSRDGRTWYKMPTEQTYNRTNSPYVRFTMPWTANGYYCRAYAEFGEYAGTVWVPRLRGWSPSMTTPQQTGAMDVGTIALN